MNDMAVNDLLARIARGKPEKLNAPAGMWGHDCPEECGLLWVACGEDCNWCGARQPQTLASELAAKAFAKTVWDKAVKG